MPNVKWKRIMIAPEISRARQCILRRLTAVTHISQLR